MRRAAFPAAIVLVLLQPAAADEPAETRVVEVTASVVGLERTPEQGRREALQRARDEAVAEATGIRIAAQQLRLLSEQDGAVRDGFSYIVLTATEGRIVREQVTYRTRLEGETPVYEATLVAEVALEEGVRDPGFTIDLAARPTTRTYRDGEPLVLEVTASRRCHLTLIHVGYDGSLEVLVPNRFLADLEIGAGETVRFPGESARFEVRALLPEGRERERERLLVVATLDPVSFSLDASAGDELANAEARDALTALNRWLLRIPVARRVELLWDYEITR
jgi:hypothetical protein